MNKQATNGSRTFQSEWLILPKLLYFWLNMAIYTASSFITKFFVTKWNLKEYQIAFMMSLQITIFFGAMFWTNLVDRLHTPRRILLTAVSGYAVFFCCLALPVFGGPDQGLHRLIYSAVVLALTWTFSSCFYPIVDSTILAILERNPNFTKDHYTNQRLWGVPAHVLGITISGWAFDYFGIMGYQVTVLLSTIIFALVAFLTMPSRLDAPKKKLDAEKLEAGESASTLNINPTRTLLANPSFLFLLFFALSGGILRSTLTNFQTHHMEKGYKTSSFFAALTSISRIGSEVSVYIFSKRIAACIGIYWMLILSQVAGLMRVFGYAFAPTHGYWRYLPFFLEFPKGLNSGLLVASSVRIASDIAPPGCGSSAQGLFSGTYTGLSMFIGGIINGSLLLISNNSLPFMFQWVGFLSLTCTVLCFIKYGYFDRVMKVPFVKQKAIA